MAIEVRTRGMLFDMDGVLVDSTPSVLRSWRRWASEYGVAGAETLTIPHGQRAIDLVKMLAPEVDPQLGLARIDEIELNDLADIAVLSGAAELLKSLPINQWAIVTSARRSLLQARLQAAGLTEPHAVVTADDVTQGKPNPEPYLAGARLLGLAASACVVVEDAPSGVRAGKAAGARVLAVLTTSDAQELQAAGAEWIVRSLAQVAVTVVDGEIVLCLKPDA
jgi:sugar-phosphatase